MKRLCQIRKLSVEFRHSGANCGHVTCELDQSGPSLWISTNCGFANRDVLGVYNIGLPNPAKDLLALLFQCALGEAPLGVFADWLEDREEDLLPNVRPGWHPTSRDVREQWDGMLSELRRIGGSLLSK